MRSVPLTQNECDGMMTLARALLPIVLISLSMKTSRLFLIIGFACVYWSIEIIFGELCNLLFGRHEQRLTHQVIESREHPLQSQHFLAGRLFLMSVIHQPRALFFYSTTEFIFSVCGFAIQPTQRTKDRADTGTDRHAQWSAHRAQFGPEERCPSNCCPCCDRAANAAANC